MLGNAESAFDDVGSCSRPKQSRTGVRLVIRVASGALFGHQTRG